MPAKSAKPILDDEDELLTTKPTKNEKAKDEENDDEDNKSGSDDSDVDEDGLNWWERAELQASKKGEKRWDTLSHNGPMFEPDYVPHGLKLRYAGQDYAMHPAVEEVANMYAIMRESPYYLNEIFRGNFFKSWKEVMAKHQPELREIVRSLALVDFSNMWHKFAAERDARKNAPKEVKKRLADEKKKAAEPYSTCKWDGRVEKVANYRVEPPGLFRGRGKHPLMGTLKTRTYPEDITINIGEGEKPPACPPGHKWGKIINDHTVTWLAMWTDNVTNNNKYVMLAPTSMIKGMSDREKFERARRLKLKIDDIRADYRGNWVSNVAANRELGIALYFIDKLALRVGNEKGSDEADTVGCCSLRKEHMTLLDDNKVHLDFLGKDSIRFSQTVEIDPKAHQVLNKLLDGKKPADQIFSNISPSDLNDYLKKHMSDLTAKVFRTYNASVCLDDQLRKDPPPKSASEGEKLIFFNKCNTDVAILCNHQKAVGKSYYKAQKQTNEKIEYLKQNIQRLQELKDRIEVVGRKKALDEFYAEDDKIQNEWLAEHGNEKKRADFIAYVAKRDAARAKGKDLVEDDKKSSKKSSSSAGSKRSRSSDKDEKGSSKKGAKTEEKKKPASSGKKEKKIEVEEDEDLAALLAKDQKSKKGAKKEEVKAEEDDNAEEEEKPAKGKKAAAAAKPAAKPAAKAAAKPAAKPAAKKAAPKKGGKK